MKKISFSFATAALLIASAVPLRAQPAAPLPEMSAEVHMLKKDGQTFAQGKIYMTHNAARMEMLMPGQPIPMVNINRMDKNLMWMLMPEKKYMEQPLPFDPVTRNEIPKGWTQDCAPGETIDGHPTDKCLIKGDVGGKKLSTTIWKAKDLNGVVIRNIGESGAGMELKNIVVAAQPPSLFEVPADYKKMELPAGMSEMMKKNTPK
ncbi:MAG TPA: hypothetical protein VFX30_11530 [bacterium]|nr:hypothetical protein [bacterium]